MLLSIISIMLGLLPATALGTFNLFISAKEVKKLMGLEIELFYVKDGIVNNYAVGYGLNVNSSIEELEFVWESLVRIPVSFSFNNRLRF